MKLYYNNNKSKYNKEKEKLSFGSFQIGGGIWGGCLTVATGISGIMATAQKLCPLKSSAQKLVHTVFLALSLISFAIAQLVVLLAATGLVRDTNNVQIEESTDIEVRNKFTN